MKLENYTLEKKHRDKKRFILEIRHTYIDTQIFIDINHFEQKLKEYGSFEIKEIKEDKTTLTISIDGKLKEKGIFKTLLSKVKN